MTDHDEGADSPHRRIATSVVQVFKRHTGRGPTKARAHIDDNLVSILLQDVLTPYERALVDTEGAEDVRRLRWHAQEAMREDLIAAVEAEVPGRVIAFMSANHLDPDIAMETFVLEGHETS